MEDVLIEVAQRAPYDVLNSLLRTCRRVSKCAVDPTTFLQPIPNDKLVGMQFPNGMRHGLSTLSFASDPTVMYDFGRPVDWMACGFYRFGADMRVISVASTSVHMHEYEPVGCSRNMWKTILSVNIDPREPIARFREFVGAARLELIREWYCRQKWPPSTGGCDVDGILHNYLSYLPGLE